MKHTYIIKPEVRISGEIGFIVYKVYTFLGMKVPFYASGYHSTLQKAQDWVERVTKAEAYVKQWS